MKEARIGSYIELQADKRPEAPAFYLSAQEFLSYGKLAAQIDALAAELSALGCDRRHRLAIVLPHGAEAALVFYAVTQVAAAVPLNPACSAFELTRYLEIAGVDAVITTTTCPGALTEAAANLHIPLLTLCGSVPAGLAIESAYEPLTAARKKQGPEKEDAVILFTSGTTALPKVVPLTNANLLQTVATTAPLFQLEEKDRGISVTPLYHIYGIVGPLLSAAASGGSIAFLPAFNPAAFFALLRDLQITWYAGSPAIHHAVAEYAEKLSVRAEDYSLRLVRSGGAPLPPKLAEKLEKLFGAVVVQGYGLTETAGLATFSAPQAGKVKIESVGFAMGCEVAVMNEDAAFLPAGEQGQIMIRGANVAAGYENGGPEEQAFRADGWFATGDCGYFDEEGYLFICGRSKEMINRGGLKFSPYEVEEALLSHEAVTEAAVFAVPHPYLGEAPCALVVLEPASSLTPSALTVYLGTRLSQAKIPCRIFFTGELPKSANGKVQRLRLYEYVKSRPEKFSFDEELADEENSLEPFDATEQKLAPIWRGLLRTKKFGRGQDFFAAGGDSLMAEMLFAEIEKAFGLKLPASLILANRTFAALAELIRNEGRSRAEFEFLLPIKEGGSLPPLFCIHNVGGDVLTYRKLADYLGKNRPVYGLALNIASAKLRHPLHFADLASLYIEEMRLVQPRGPYHVAGHSLGGLLASEVCRQLLRQGQEVGFLGLFDTLLIKSKIRKPPWFKLLHNLKKVAAVPFSDILHYLREKTAGEIARHKVRRFMKKYPAAPDPALDESALKRSLLRYALRQYRMEPYPGSVTYFNAQREVAAATKESVAAWTRLAARIRVIDIDADHSSIVQEPDVAELAQRLEEELKLAERGFRTTGG